MEIVERQGVVGDVTAFWREALGAPVLYLHGVPTDGADWLPFLERTGGYAPDLPGFGRSDKPAHFPYSIEGYGQWVRDFADAHSLDRLSLVVHDWGGAALSFAQAAPERIDRLVVIDSVPLLPGYRWHRIARVWRTPLVGEFAMGSTGGWTLRALSREFLAAPGPAPRELTDRILSHFDHGTQRAILKLYRSAPPERLEAAGAGLGRIEAPALVLWGEDDPYVPASFAQAYADRLGGPAEVDVVKGARHWPWLDQPALVERVASFVAR